MHHFGIPRHDISIIAYTITIEYFWDFWSSTALWELLSISLISYCCIYTESFSSGGELLAWFSHHIAQHSKDLDLINSFCTQLLKVGQLEQISYNDILNNNKTTPAAKLQEFKVCGSKYFYKILGGSCYNESNSCYVG